MTVHLHKCYKKHYILSFNCNCVYQGQQDAPQIGSIKQFTAFHVIVFHESFCFSTAKNLFCGYGLLMFKFYCNHNSCTKAD